MPELDAHTLNFLKGALGAVGILWFLIKAANDTDKFFRSRKNKDRDPGRQDRFNELLSAVKSIKHDVKETHDIITRQDSEGHVTYPAEIKKNGKLIYRLLVAIANKIGVDVNSLFLELL